MTSNLDHAKCLSPRRNTTAASSVEELVSEQLEHFGISSDSEYGTALSSTATKLYQAQSDVMRLWDITKGKWGGMNPHDKVVMEKGATTHHIKQDILHYSFYTVEQHLKQIAR